VSTLGRGATRRSLQRPRLPALGTGSNGDGGYEQSASRERARLSDGSWPALGFDSCETRTLRAGADGKSRKRSSDERYLISSLPSVRLTAQHWLLVARRHWGVETSHQILDTAFAEDDHPWIESNPRAALVVAILRRIAYTLLALFRSVTQRSDERAVPWKALIADIFFALITATEHQLNPPRSARSP
jgi:hypothetical protein